MSRHFHIYLHRLAMGRLGTLLGTALIVAIGCHSSSGDRDAGPARDGAADDGAPGDGAVNPCDCPEGQPVQMFHSCTPPLEVGCLADLCTPEVTDCDEGYSCEECSAAACCICAACLPSCVRTGPAQGPLPEYLKLASVFGPAGQEQTIIIEGFPFYIGALFYLARVGDSADLPEVSYPDVCSHGFTAPAHGPGIEPVWISQYGGGTPWVLAGFFTFTSGDYPTCVQPGFACTGSDTCCETAEVPMACREGRCRTE